MELNTLTGGWFPNLPKAYEKSVVLGGARVLFPCADPEGQAAILSEHILDVAHRAFRAGQEAAKQKVRDAIW